MCVCVQMYIDTYVSWSREHFVNMYYLISPWTKWPPFHRRQYQNSALLTRCGVNPPVIGGFPQNGPIVGIHDDIPWKSFPRYWLLVRGIHRATGPLTKVHNAIFDVSFDVILRKRLNKQSNYRWRHDAHVTSTKWHVSYEMTSLYIYCSNQLLVYRVR